MRLARLGMALLLGAILGEAPISAQDLMLTEACEEGFRQLIQMAQDHRLGDDVVNANVGVEKIRVRVELLRGSAPSKVIWLEAKRSPQTFARFFDMTAGEGAGESDLARVGRALDEIFTADPFAVAGFEASPGGESLPGFADAWTNGGWLAVVRVFERRMMAFASVEYTRGILVALAIGVAAGLALLWGSHPRGGADRAAAAGSDRAPRA
jgi:hypothetical protein